MLFRCSNQMAAANDDEDDDDDKCIGKSLLLRLLRVASRLTLLHMEAVLRPANGRNEHDNISSSRSFDTPSQVFHKVQSARPF
jgi:hypothetical protein